MQSRLCREPCSNFPSASLMHNNSQKVTKLSSSRSFSSHFHSASTGRDGRITSSRSMCTLLAEICKSSSLGAGLINCICIRNGYSQHLIRPHCQKASGLSVVNCSPQLFSDGEQQLAELFVAPHSLRRPLMCRNAYLNRSRLLLMERFLLLIDPLNLTPPWLSPIVAAAHTKSACRAGQTLLDVNTSGVRPQ